MGKSDGMKFKSHVFDEKAISRSIVRIAHEIMEQNETAENLIIAGIKTRGVPIAHRISECIYEKIDNSRKIPVIVLDITDFRDDVRKNEETADQQEDISESVEGKTVIMTDDVICTGRTARAAMDALISMGRPGKIQLAVLVDRGHRELPLRPDYVGKNIPTSKNESIEVKLKETDGTESIDIYEK